MTPRKKPATKTPTKPKKKPTRLSKRAKKQIITRILTKQPGLHLRLGFQKALRGQFREKYGVHISVSWMSELVKETLEDLESAKGYLNSKRWYLLQYQQLYEKEAEAQDKGGQKETLRDMTKLEGHLKDTHVFEGGDEAMGKQIEAFFDDMVKGDKKKAAKKTGGDHGKE